MFVDRYLLAIKKWRLIIKGLCTIVAFLLVRKHILICSSAIIIFDCKDTKSNPLNWKSSVTSYISRNTKRFLVDSNDHLWFLTIVDILTNRMLVSSIITTYNRLELLKRAIESSNLDIYYYLCIFHRERITCRTGYVWPKLKSIARQRFAYTYNTGNKSLLYKHATASL